MRAAIGMVAVICAVVLLENQADARSGRLFKNRDNCCEPVCCDEATVAADEPAPVIEEDAAVDECCCVCDPCDRGRKHRRNRGGKLFNRSWNRGCCEPICGC